MTRAGAMVLAAALALGLAASARAQGRATGRSPGPLLLRVTAEPATSQHPYPALTPPQTARLQSAQSFRDAGLFDRARETLLELLKETPHHALVVTELGRLYSAREDWAAVERLARSERLAQRDSVLLGHELSLALERLGRPREAAQIAVEGWCVEPEETEWASATVLRLAGTEPRGVREVLRRAIERHRDRSDLARASARLEWLLGEPKAALRILLTSERPDLQPPLRWTFAEELLNSGVTRDSLGAVEALLDLAGDARQERAIRLGAAQRAWEVYLRRGADREGAPRVHRALRDVPGAEWPQDVRVGVVRGLREGGLTGEARSLLQSQDSGRALAPALSLERALADLRDGPPERALPALAEAAQVTPDGMFRYAEALFFAGESDSALAWYQRVSENPKGPFAGAALERIYLIEDNQPRAAIPVFGRIAYREWRGDAKGAMALTDSLYQALPRGALWAQAAIRLAAQRDAAGATRIALEPLLALADSLPDDRLAPLARQRAGDLYLNRLKDETRALAQYEECLARYPRAWNAPEVRRKLEQLRRERRF